MIKDLEKLIQLQEIDLRIHDIRKSKQEFPKTVESLQASLDRAQEAVTAAAGRVTEAKGEKKAVHDKTEDAQNALKKSEDRLANIKTNREYDAVHAEIESSKRIVDQSASRTEAVDKDIEARTAAFEEARTELEKVKAENEPKILELKEKIASIDSKISEVKKERDILVPGISKAALRIYEYILKKRSNAQIISRVDAKKRVCGICHKVLESQLLNEIRKADKIISCQSCGSIFVIEGAEAEPVHQ
jgi:uncharacterized protein